MVVKPKGIGQVAEKPRYGKSKLPPRLARQKEQRERDKTTKGFDMKIENWDNELANNMPSSPSDNAEGGIPDMKTSKCVVSNIVRFVTLIKEINQLIIA